MRRLDASAVSNDDSRGEAPPDEEEGQETQGHDDERERRALPRDHPKDHAQGHCDDDDHKAPARRLTGTLAPPRKKPSDRESDAEGPEGRCRPRHRDAVVVGGASNPHEKHEEEQVDEGGKELHSPLDARRSRSDRPRRNDRDDQIESLTQVSGGNAGPISDWFRDLEVRWS